MKPTILVTGGTGYIGSHTVVELQKAGWKPSVSLDYLKFSSRGTAAGIPRLDQQSLLLKLNLPIYQGGAVGARVRTAREQAGKAAGMRTHMLVSLAAASFTLISFDFHARLIAQGLSGS